MKCYLLAFDIMNFNVELILSAGENKLNGPGIFGDIAIVDASNAILDILVQQVQVRCGGGACLPRHVCRFPGPCHTHRA